jgi:hypothetical protein
MQITNKKLYHASLAEPVLCQTQGEVRLAKSIEEEAPRTIIAGVLQPLGDAGATLCRPVRRRSSQNAGGAE